MGRRLDGLDSPLITALDASSSEPGAADQQPIFKPEGDAAARCGQGLLPVDWKPQRLTSPIFNYPYGRTREALLNMSRAREADACHGYKLRYINPANGDYAMPTIAAFIQLPEVGFETARYRAAVATILVIVEGEGQTRIGEQEYSWRPKRHDRCSALDVCTAYRAARERDFSFSDRAL